MKRICIVINKGQVIRDVDAITFKRVDGVMSDQSDSVRNALSSDGEDVLDHKLLHRYMEGRDAEVRAKLAFCIIPEETDGDLVITNESLNEQPDFQFNLNAPDYFNKDSAMALGQKIHRYFVDGVAYDWYMRQGVPYSVGADDLDRMLTDIAVSLRKPFVKRPLQPFGPATK